MIKKDPLDTNYMDIEFEDMINSAYSNFIESIKSNAIKRGYKQDLRQFLDKMSDDFFIKYLDEKPKSRNLEDLAESFVGSVALSGARHKTRSSLNSKSIEILNGIFA